LVASPLKDVRRRLFGAETSSSTEPMLVGQQPVLLAPVTPVPATSVPIAQRPPANRLLDSQKPQRRNEAPTRAVADLVVQTEYHLVCGEDPLHRTVLLA
jgi:hypothetical protein